MNLVHEFIERAAEKFPAFVPLRTRFRQDEGLKTVRALISDPGRHRLPDAIARIEMSARNVKGMSRESPQYPAFREKQTENIIYDMYSIMSRSGITRLSRAGEPIILESLEILSLSYGRDGVGGIPPQLVEAMAESNKIVRGDNTNYSKIIFWDAFLEKVSRLIDKQEASLLAEREKNIVEYKKVILRRHAEVIMEEAYAKHNVAREAALIDILDFHHRGA